MSEKNEKATYRVLYSYEILVKAGADKENVVNECATFFKEAVILNPNLSIRIEKLTGDDIPDTRMRIKAEPGKPPIFIRLPIEVESLAALAQLDAEAGENAKIKGESGEGYVYRPDVQPGTDGLDLRYTVSSRAPKGGVWIDATYLRHASQEAARRQAQAQQRGGR